MRCQAIGATCSTLLVLSILGCETASQPPSTPDATARESAVDTPAQPEGTTKMSNADSTAVKISPADAAANKLPPATISLNPAGKHFDVQKFPFEHQYLMLSGPPGEPLGLVVEHVSNVTADDAGWKKLIDQRFANQSPQLGTAAKLDVGGEKNATITCTTGSSQARAHHLLVLVPIPKSKDAILVDFWHGAGQSETPKPEAMAKDGEFSALLGSLSVRPE